ANLLLCSPLILFLFFFFFQAEDGIRDKLVTGVQTCALPILRQISGRHPPRLQRVNSEICLSCEAIERYLGEEEERVHALRGISRSEERRVGKECSSRREPDHDRKKKWFLGREKRVQQFGLLL